ncbi:2OG-Fe(II) oxygenase [Microvirga terricola]|uniref:2OG-Fe(II) oxygenase n=1 Tax=Microvirga terricola TaxID=2719797 RepID=A0ABX0VDI5_9HYPH|nr:2OG-Fe(II) oxygenase [Microvirga terricola]NIX77224.1 2OG-Fe(II) oxygenase [Microvirga terricola]
MSLINLASLRAAEASRDPYNYVLAPEFLQKSAIDDLRRDFPDITKPGYLTVDEVKLHGRFKQLIEELEGPELTEELSRKFGLDLHPYPRLTTIMKRSQPKYGAIHTDGPSKVMTMLVYMNDEWEKDDGGRLRVLYDGQDYEKYKLEVPPMMGTMFAFLRSDNSWHGHLPFSGERRVVQIAWVKSQADVERKKKNNKVAQFFKGIFGR